MSRVRIIESDFLIKRPSNIHGVGIFTLKPIKKNTKFYLIPLIKISSTTAPRFAKIAEEMFVNDIKVLNFVNHSCDPNSKIIFNKKEAYLIALSTIDSNEEITVNYSLTEEHNKLVNCTCKASCCKKHFFIS